MPPKKAKITIVSSVSLADTTTPKSVPQVSVAGSKRTSVSNTARKGMSRPQPIKNVNTPSTPDKKISDTPNVPETISPAVTSTVLIDSTGKPASNHPLANVISLFLAQNKGHTGDLLITDGTANGAKYLIRQNKPSVKAAQKDAQTPKGDPSLGPGASPAFFISPQTTPTSKTVNKTAIASIAAQQQSTPVKAVANQNKTGNSKIKLIDVRSTNNSSPSNTTTTTTTTTTALSTGTTAKQSKENNQPPASPARVVILKPNLPPTPKPGSIISKVKLKPGNEIQAASGATKAKPVTSLVPVTAVAPSNVKELTNVSGTSVTQPQSVLLPESTSNQPNLQKILPKPPTTQPAGNSIKENVGNKNAQVSAETITKNPKSPTKRAEPFTIVQKNSEANTQNGTTTNKATFVIRGNGPLSSDQLEAIVRDNLLKNGTIKDGAKILIRHRGGNPSNQGPDSIKNGTFIVKESKIVPVGESNMSKALVPVTKKITIPDKNKPRPASPSFPFRDPFRDETINRYPKGMTPERVAELRKSNKRNLMKLSRQAKLIEKLKNSKEEQIQNLPPEDLAKLVKRALPGFAGKFFEEQLLTSVVENKKHGHRWEDDSKVFALGLWNRSPAAFKLMQRAFKLPSVKTLTNWVTNVPPDVDFFEKLKLVLEKPSAEKDQEMEDLLGLEEPTDDDTEKKVNDTYVDDPQEKPGKGEPLDEEEEPEDENLVDEPLFPDEEPMETIEEDDIDTSAMEGENILEKACMTLNTNPDIHMVEEVVIDDGLIICA